MGNGFGKVYRVTTFGESHGGGVGGVVEGCPPGLRLDMEEVCREMGRRRPGQSSITTGRVERDEVEFLSGLYGGVTTGTPIGFVTRNTDAHSEDYVEIGKSYRPSHGDYTYEKKYGIRDPRGGGRASARETLARCVGGAIAKQVLLGAGITFRAYTTQVGSIGLSHPYGSYDLEESEKNAVRCPDASVAREMEALIREVQLEGDSVGGIITCVIKGVGAGLGEPVFDKLQALLAHAMLSIPAAKGFEYGDGFEAPLYRGSLHNDAFRMREGKISPVTNFSGGIQGGISNGEDIYFRVAFKAPPTILRAQESVSVSGEAVVLNPKGRHDACVVPRAVSVVEAMSAITILDLHLRNSADVH
ncbi:MAG: chorismate synthase [Tannerellaceae bacterium]|jgi:chorismate synthase|nr:chorismate synthase [Tannerellaceae bacterium]